MFATTKTIKQETLLHTGMITQNENNTQDILKKVYDEVPVILSARDGKFYLLIKELNKKLNNFIIDGEKTGDLYHALSTEQESYIAKLCREQKFTLTYRSQRMEYLKCEVAIIYPQISSPENDMAISIVPWFFLPHQPYPVFVYAYAVSHYLKSADKSLKLSAEVAGEVFGIPNLNKSTVLRNFTEMEHLFDISKIERPLSIENRATQTTEEMIDAIADILKNRESIDELKKIYGERLKCLPKRIKNTEKISMALSGIPNELLKVIKPGSTDRGKSYDSRRRPSRPHGDKKEPLQRTVIHYVESHEIRLIRINFIAAFRNIVMDAAKTYHRLLM